DPSAWSKRSTAGHASTSARPPASASHEFDAGQRPYSEEHPAHDLALRDDAEHPRVLRIAAVVAHHPVGILGDHPVVEIRRGYPVGQILLDQPLAVAVHVTAVASDR